MKLLPGTISHGTLKLDDLLEKFANTLALHSHGKNRDLIRESLMLAAEIREPEEPHDPEWTSAHICLDELSSALNDLCPDGYYFGAHEGDASDFGVWPSESDEEFDPQEEFEKDSPIWSAEDIADENYQLDKEGA